MVTRILSGKSIRGLLNYNENKVAAGNAELILASKFGAEILDLELRDKIRRFEELTILNGRTKTNAIHVMLNFDHQDKLPTEKLQTIAIDYMERIGFGEQPFLVYQHRDASHPHIHIVTTNIQQNGERIPIHNIGRDKDEKIRLAMQKEYGLVRAESRTKDPLVKGLSVGPATYAVQPTRQSIYNVVTAVLREYKFTSLAEYNAVLREFNVTADRGAEGSRMFERRGLVYAVLDQAGKRVGVPIKASSLAGKPILDIVERKFLNNGLKRKDHIGLVREAIDKTVRTNHRLTRQAFSTALRAQNIGVIFRQNETGQIYGVTYVDHNSRCVFNGSDLGKQYSAKALLSQLGSLNQSKPEQPEQPALPIGRSQRNLAEASEVTASSEEGLLELLLQKPDIDPLSRLRERKKRRKKKGSSIQSDLGSQMR